MTDFLSAPDQPDVTRHARHDADDWCRYCGAPADDGRRFCCPACRRAYAMGDNSDRLKD